MGFLKNIKKGATKLMHNTPEEKAYKKEIKQAKQKAYNKAYKKAAIAEAKIRARKDARHKSKPFLERMSAGSEAFSTGTSNFNSLLMGDTFGKSKTSTSKRARKASSKKGKSTTIFVDGKKITISSDTKKERSKHQAPKKKSNDILGF